MKINNKIFALIAVFFIGAFFSKASDNPRPRVRTLTQEEIVEFGVQKLDGLIRLNAANKRLGEESYNRYIYFTKNLDIPIDKIKEYVWGENYEDRKAQLEELNKKLVSINKDLKAPLYIGVNLNMGDVVSTTKLKGFSTVSALEDLQPENDKKDLKELLVTPVSKLYTAINNDIASSVKEKPITIQAIGFFKLFYTKGEKDKVFSSVWRSQQLVMKNFGKERKSVIKTALMKGGLGFKVDKGRNIKGANAYFDRYAAAIKNYWNADFVNDYTFHNVSSIEEWYKQNLDNKDTGPFKAEGEKYVHDYTGLFFDFKTNLNLYLKGYTNSTKYGKPKVVITDDFTDQDRLFQINEVLTTTKENGAFIWIHIDKDNKVVKQNIYRNRNKIQLDPTLETRLENFGNLLFSKGFSSGKALILLAEMDAILTQFGSVVFNGLTGGLNAIKIPKEFWDSAAENYYFKELNTLVAGVVGVEQLVLEVQNDIAFISGVYNGLIGTLGFITGTAAASFDVKIFINKILTDKGYRDDLLQQANKVVTFLKDDTSREAAWLLTKTLVLSGAEKAWDYQWEKVENGNLTGVHYMAGNIAFEVVIAVLSAGASVEAGIAKEFLAVLKWAIDPLEFVIKAGTKFVTPVVRLMAKGCKIAVDGAVSLGGKVLFKIDFNARIIKRVGEEFLKSLDETRYSLVLSLEIPEGIALHNGIKELENKILKIVSDTSGGYRVVVEELGNLEAQANQLKDGFNITSINKAKQLVEKLGADKVGKLLQKADIIKKADGDVTQLLDDIADTPDFAKHIDDLTEDIVEAWKLLISRSVLRKSFDALSAIVKIKKNPELINFVANVDDFLKNITGWGNTGVQKGYVEILENIDRFVTFVKSNNINCVECDKFLKIFTTKAKNDKQAIFWILEDIVSDVGTFANKTLLREVRVNKVNGANGFIDVWVKGTKQADDLLIEYKWYGGDKTVSKDLFIDEFVLRDLNNITDLKQLQWRIKGKKLSKEKVVEYLEGVGNKFNPDMIKLFDNFAEKINYTDEINNFSDLVKFLKNNDNWYNSIFK